MSTDDTRAMAFVNAIAGEVAAEEAWTDEESRLAVLLHDLDCSDRTCEPHVFADKFAKARRLLASDWLAAHDARVRAADAAEIERLRDSMTYLEERVQRGDDATTEASAERDRLAAGVRELADEWAAAHGRLGVTINDLVQHQCAARLRALLAPADDEVRADG